MGREPYFGVTVGFANGFTAIRTQALTDPLTGLANRRHFDERLAHAMVEAERGDRVWSLSIADVDHFKTFNDTYGYLIGDQVLRLVASVLIQNTEGLMPEMNSRSFFRIRTSARPKQ